MDVALRSPFVWGAVGAAGFYGLVYGGPLGTEFIKRYFTRHPVEYGETLLFAIGLAVLVLRIVDVANQRSLLRRFQLAPILRPAASLNDRCHALVDAVGRLPLAHQEDYYPRRIRGAVDYVYGTGSGAGLSDELKYLAEQDSRRMQSGYALFHVIIWAIPILGFLGTVIGITMALNSLDPKAIDESMMRVTTGLGLKFDTTALALGMSMLLMFAYFIVHRVEVSLLEDVDRRLTHELSDRVFQLAAGNDSQLAILHRIAESMSRTAEQLVRQAPSGSHAKDSELHWDRVAEAIGNRLKQALAQGMADSLSAHARQIAAAEQAVAEQNRQHWEQMRQTQSENLRTMGELQAELGRQAKTLVRAIEASGEVTRLQDALNRNLGALGGARHIEQTVSGLAAAIHLLNARLAESPTTPQAIELEPTVRTAKVA